MEHFTCFSYTLDLQLLEVIEHPKVKYAQTEHVFLEGMPYDDSNSKPVYLLPTFLQNEKLP